MNGTGQSYGGSPLHNMWSISLGCKDKSGLVHCSLELQSIKILYFCRSSSILYWQILIYSQSQPLPHPPYSYCDPYSQPQSQIICHSIPCVHLNSKVLILPPFEEPYLSIKLPPLHPPRPVWLSPLTLVLHSKWRKCLCATPGFHAQQKSAVRGHV